MSGSANAFGSSRRSRLFVCRDASDAPFVERLSADLDLLGYETVAAIGEEDAIHGVDVSNPVDCFLVILSPVCLASESCLRQMNKARIRSLRERDFLILSALHAEVRAPAWLARRDLVDFREDYGGALLKLSVILRTKLQ